MVFHFQAIMNKIMNRNQVYTSEKESDQEINNDIIVKQNEKTKMKEIMRKNESFDNFVKLQLPWII
tara:strand:+ start:101 stop:298 length:198 start_codon:yes stop_codon:yes gene_type:complete